MNWPAAQDADDPVTRVTPSPPTRQVEATTMDPLAEERLPEMLPVLPLTREDLELVGRQLKRTAF